MARPRSVGHAMNGPAVATPGRVRRAADGAVDRLKTLVPVRTRGRIAMGRVALRIPTGPIRLLPDFLIIGGQRCGTSSLYSYLGRHPEVVPSLRKETQFFSAFHPRGETWYRAHFPLAARRSLRRTQGRRLLSFEATPDYMLDPRSASRAWSLVTEARIIALLRDPAERALSHYQHNVRLGNESLSFPDALDAEEERTSGELERMLADPEYPGRRLQMFGYVARGLYATQIERWMSLWPRDRMLVLFSEDFFSRTPEVFADVLDFLGLSPWQPAEFRNYSYGYWSVRAVSALEPAVAERLRGVFRPHHERLRALLGTDPGWPA